MLSIGSPEWFYEQSRTSEMIAFNDMIEKLREKFLDRFSADSMLRMNGNELLDNVFSNNPDSMMQLLMFDKNDSDLSDSDLSYRKFGAPGKQKNHCIVYQDKSNTWFTWTNKEVAKRVDQYAAEKKAEYVRDNLMSCIHEIERANVFKTIEDYEKLQDRIKTVFFYKYPWTLKYYQMLFPQYFPGMYAKHTLERALKVLGLKNHGDINRLMNAGQISLFIRRCNINNIVFNEIYAKEWGWEGNVSPCENACENLKDSLMAVKDVNISFYKISSGTSGKIRERIERANAIEKEIDSLHVEGKEREALVKIRVNQDEFRNKLLKKYSKCCLCGVTAPTLLIASHIKPWSVCEPEEKLDESNGLLLCPNHDKLFDAGYITFNDEGEIIISDELAATDRIFMNVNDDMKIKLASESVNYLKYHRNHVFKGKQ